jgi:hypothetical protein
MLTRNRYICNVFTIAMAPQGGLLDFRPITPTAALTLIAFPPENVNCTHAVGHEQTAQLANKQLGRDAVKFNRTSIQLQPGEDLVLCQYIGPRLPEGVTVLPEGAEIRWYYAVYLRHPVDEKDA